MTDLGLLLKKARMEKKISLDDLQETTKIRKRYLEAIEEGNYKVLPGNFYVRAFIKSYAEAVGLDPNEVLQLYQNVIPATEPETIEPIRTTRTSTTRNTERLGKWASNIMVISFVILILGIIYYFMNINYKGTNDASNQLPKQITDKIEPAAPKTDTGAPPSTGTNGGQLAQSAPQPIPSPPVETAPKNEVKLVKSERGTDYYAVSGTDKLKIEVKVVGDECWMKIDELGASRQQLHEGILKNGEVKSWELANPAYLRFGKASAMEIVINGQSYPVGNQANVKNVQVDFLKS